MKSTVVLLVLGLLLAACGDEPAPTAVVTRDPAPHAKGNPSVQTLPAARTPVRPSRSRALLLPDAEAATVSVRGFLRDIDPSAGEGEVPGSARVQDVMLRTQVEGEDLRVVALPADPNDGFEDSIGFIERLRRWMQNDGVEGIPVKGGAVKVAGRATWAHYVRAAQQVFEEHGHELHAEEVLQDSYALLARDDAGQLQWAFWMVIYTDHSVELGTGNYGAPFDNDAEAALTEQVVARATSIATTGAASANSGR